MAEHGGHESRDVQLKWIVISGAVFFGLAFVVLLFMRPVYRFLADISKPAPMAETPEQEVRAPAPDVHAGEVAAASGLQLREMRAEEEATLSEYGWVDRQRGTVRIPVERAMELVLQRGLPARTASAAAQAVPEPEAEGRFGESNGWSQGGAP